jgi:hypothetical protein
LEEEIMDKDKKNKRNGIICLIVLDILSIFCVIFLCLYAKNIDINSLSTIIEESDGQITKTTITVSHYPNILNFYWCSLLFISIDLIIFTIIKIVEYIKNNRIKLKYGAIIITSINFLMAILLFPIMLWYSIGINILVIVLYITIYLLFKNFNKINS